jgi:hypothetical protein
MKNETIRNVIISHLNSLNISNGLILHIVLSIKFLYVFVSSKKNNNKES